MTKRSSRPWEEIQRAKEVLAGPSITLNGTVFYSDRFYLNRSSPDGPDTVAPQQEKAPHACQCGVEDEPPLFSRIGFVNSLELKAAVAATYTLDLKWMSKSFPDLVGPSSRIPTLILHGRSGLQVDQLELGDQCFITSVASNWSPASRVSRDPAIQFKDKPVACRGVHHPKFWLLWETSGCLVVLVTTANLVPCCATVEGTWMQRFRPKRTKSSKETNDFGAVLQDFMKKLDLSSAEDQPLATFCSQFLSLHLGDIANAFHFEKAQVHLVSVVPGTYNNKTSHAYGAQRVRHILGQQNTPRKSRDDRLVIQPTSFGGNWKTTDVARLVRDYMAVGVDHHSYHDHVSWVEKVDIVWPTESYIRQCHHEQSLQNNLQSGLASRVFLSSQLFNSCDLATISRMCIYHPDQSTKGLVPHFKSIARVAAKRKYKKDPQADEYLDWFLLTSACFSHGAQGVQKVDNIISYSNYELGVLFTTRLSKDVKQPSRIYAHRPHSCCCLRNDLIPLPIPFCLRPKQYLSEDKMIMKETPSFHEIGDDSRWVGHMSLTPIGKMQQKNAFAAA